VGGENKKKKENSKSWKEKEKKSNRLSFWRKSCHISEEKRRTNRGAFYFAKERRKLPTREYLLSRGRRRRGKGAKCDA